MYSPKDWYHWCIVIIVIMILLWKEKQFVLFAISIARWIDQSDVGFTKTDPCRNIVTGLACIQMLYFRLKSGMPLMLDSCHWKLTRWVNPSVAVATESNVIQPTALCDATQSVQGNFVCSLTNHWLYRFLRSGAKPFVPVLSAIECHRL